MADRAHTGFTPMLSRPAKRKKEDVTPSKWPKSRKRAEAWFFIYMWDHACAICWQAAKEKTIKLLQEIQISCNNIA